MKLRRSPTPLHLQPSPDWTGRRPALRRRRAAVTNSTNRWNFTSQAFGSVTTEFSTNKVTWTAPALLPATVKVVRVHRPDEFSDDDGPSSRAGNFGLDSGGRAVDRRVSCFPTSFPQGVFPFAPLAHDLTGPNFGYTPLVDELTLLWPSSVGSNGQG